MIFINAEFSKYKIIITPGKVQKSNGKKRQYNQTIKFSSDILETEDK
jgi:hypothetical protein